MVRDSGAKFDDYSISLKIRQILLHWGCELTEEDLHQYFFCVSIKMNYYQFIRKERLRKAQE